ncbi:MAG: FixH family protein [Myxococcales bacterium]|nr:FixH family protein [Myxococcales bacterium]MCB9523994.1 FixH family protein [Myxococcales bacterium]
MRLRTLALLACFTLPLAACGDDDSTPAGEMQHDDGITRSESGNFMLHPMMADWAPTTGDHTVRFHLMNADGAVQASALTVEPWMPDHGHGSSAVPVATDMGSGMWEVSSLVFTMPGAWELRFEATIEGAVERFVMPVTVQ